jgi:hypothetical protein
MIMEELNGVKEALKTAQRMDLYPVIENLHTDNISLTTRLAAVEKENKDLRRRRARREAMTWDGQAYWLAKDGPFCPNCIDGADQLEMRMTERGDGFVTCVRCKHSMKSKVSGQPVAMPFEFPDQQGYDGFEYR